MISLSLTAYRRVAVDLNISAPTQTQALPDLTFEAGLNVIVVDLPTAFDGEYLSFAIAPQSAPLPMGLSLASDGRLSGNPSEVVFDRIIVIRAANTAGYVDAAFQITVEPGDTTDITASFGTLTKPGQGGVAVTGASVASASAMNVSDWQVSGGLLTLTASGAGNVADTYLTLDNGETVSITAGAGVMSVRDTAELNAAVYDEGYLETNAVAAIEYRADGTYGEIGGYGAFDMATLLHTVIIRPDDATGTVAPWQSFIVAGSGTHGNVTLDGVLFDKTPLDIQHNFFQPRSVNVGSDRFYMVNLTSGSRNVTVRNCVFDFHQEASRNGGKIITGTVAMEIQGADHVIEDNEIRNCVYGAILRGTNQVFQRNHLHHVFADFLNVRNLTSSVIRGNTFSDTIGWGQLLHQDYIQFVASASDLVIEGNVGFPGDFLTQVRPSGRSYGGVAEQGVDTVIVTTSLTLDPALHRNRVIRVDAPGVTITLPASAQSGEAYWFRSDAHDFTVVANTGQTHGGGLLPWTATTGAYDRTAMVYWDGAAGRWDTKLGIRAGIIPVTSDAVLNADHNVKTILCMAEAGNISITLPDTNDVPDGLSVLRDDQSVNIVTVLPAPGQSLPNGPEPVLFTDCRTFKTPTSSTWSVEKGVLGEIQGLFGNGFGFADIYFGGNVFWCNASHGYRIEEDFPGQIAQSNSFLRTWVPDANGDGIIDDADGFFTVTGGDSPGVRFKGDAAQDYALRRVMNTITTGEAVRDDGAATEIFAASFIGLDITDPATFPSAHFNGASQAAYYPLTRDDALDMALAKPGGPLDGSYIGALGTTRANGFWNFDMGAQNPSAPDSRVAAVPLPFAAGDISVADGTGSGEIEMTITAIPYANPTMTDIEIEVDGAWVSTGADAAGTHVVAGLAPGTTASVTGVRAVNAQGAGGAVSVNLSALVGGSATTYADAETPVTYDANWVDLGGTNTRTSGVLNAPGFACRWDTVQNGRAPVSATTVTMVVDVLNNGSTETVTFRLRDVTSGPSTTPNINTGSGVTANGGAEASGSVAITGGYRFWAKIQAGAADRILIEAPASAVTAADFANPAVFYADLSPAQIAAL